MRIAEVTKYYFPHRGGIETHVQEIAEGFAKKGNKVYVYASNDPCAARREELNGVSVERFGTWFTLFNAPFCPGMLAGLLRGDYDVVHVHLPDPFSSIFALLAAKIKKKPLYVTYHADIIKDAWYHLPFKYGYGFFLDLVLGSAKAIIATSPNYAEESGVLRRFRDRIRIVPNFVDAERFNPENSGAKIRDKHGLDGRKVVYFLGRLVPYKGVEYLIKAFEEVSKKEENAVLIIGGRGPLESELKALALNLGLKKVIFTSVSDEEIPGYYAACDLFVLPSVTRQEAFGIVLLEAMASGKPCVTTDISGMPYVVGDGGLTVPTRDCGALAEAVLKLLSDEGLRKELGGKARARVEKEFRKEVVVEKTRDALEST